MADETFLSQNWINCTTEKLKLECAELELLQKLNMFISREDGIVYWKGMIEHR